MTNGRNIQQNILDREKCSENPPGSHKEDTAKLLLAFFFPLNFFQDSLGI